MKKRNLISLLLLLIFPFTVNAEYKKDFIKTYQEEREAIFYSVTNTNDGAIAVGRILENSPDEKSIEARISNYTYDAIIVKYDNLGNIIWEKKYGDFGLEEEFYSIKATTDGNYIIVGMKEIQLENRAQEYTPFDSWIIKINEKGETLWEKRLYGNRNERFTDVTNTPDNGYLAVGATNSNYIEGKEEQDKSKLYGLIVKYNQDGEVKWIKTYGNNLNDIECISVTVVEDGYIITGKTEDNSFLLKVNNEGDIIWKKELEKTEMIGKIVTDLEKNVLFVIGETTKTSVVGKIIKMNKNGEIIWEKESILEPSIYISLNVTNQNHYIVTGTLLNDPNISYLVEMNSKGEMLWEEKIEEENNYYQMYDVTEHNGNLFIVGEKIHFENANPANYGASNNWNEGAAIAKYNYVKKEYNIKVESSKYGKIKTLEKAFEKDSVKISIIPDDNYELISLKIFDQFGKDITKSINYNEETNTFLMPSMDIIIKAEFDIINPKTGKAFSIFSMIIITSLIIGTFLISRQKKFYHV